MDLASKASSQKLETIQRETLSIRASIAERVRRIMNLAFWLERMALK